MADTKNLKKIDGRWRIRFKWTDPRTGKRRIMERWCEPGQGLEIARELRDQLRAEVSDVAEKNAMAAEPLTLFRDSFLTARARRSSHRGQPLRRTTLLRDARMLDDHILCDAGDWLIGRVTPAGVDELVDLWCEKRQPNGKLYAAASVNTMIKTLKLFLAYAWKRANLEGQHPAAELRAIPRSVVRGVKQPTVLSIDQVKALKASVQTHYPQHYAMVLVGLTTGQRFSEISALHWEDIDFDAEVIRFRHSQVEGDRNAGNKTHTTTTEPLFEEVRDALFEHRQRMIADEHPGVASGLVFPAAIDPSVAVHGGYMQRWTLNKVLRIACEKATWKDVHGHEQVGIPRLTPHDFRHNLTTTLVELGVPRHLVQAIIGHKTDQMTEHYSHISAEAKAAVLRPLIDAWKD